MSNSNTKDKPLGEQKKPKDSKYSLMVTEIGTQKRFKTMAEVSMQNELDFPVVMQIMEKFGRKKKREPTRI